KRPIARPDDLAGIRMRVPAGAMIADTFRALGAEPVTINSDGIYDALKTRRVDAQENPLALMELFKLDEVVKYVSMTNHMWSGFNLLAHLPTWMRLPIDIRDTIERNVAIHARLQRQDQEQLNAAARAALARRGLAFNDVESAPRTPDGKPDLSGLWLVQGLYIGDIAKDIKEGTPFTPWAAEIYKHRRDTLSKEDPTGWCVVGGVPRSTAVPYPFKILNTTG